MTETPEDVRGWSLRGSDASLTALLTLQCLITFGAIPLMAVNVADRWLLDVGHVLFAAVCAFALTNRHTVRVALLASVLVAAAGPIIWSSIGTRFHVDHQTRHEIISILAFGFNSLVTVLVARRSVGDGLVTGHRIQGAVLVYLNVAALFAIAYDILDTFVTGAIVSTAGGLMASAPPQRIAELSYFSLSTITTAGYGDIVPVHPFARGLANLEAMFGQLFPATFVARLVGLHLVHRSNEKRG